MSDLVLVTQQSDVVTISLNRPERHNSLVPALLGELLAAFRGVARQPDVRAVVLRANGPSFSTGGDIRGFYDNLDTVDLYANTLVGLLNQVILTMLALPAPIVVAVGGPVSGGSLGLVLAGDVVLVTPNAHFTPYYAVVGFSPDGGWTALLPEIIGARRAADILYHNRAIAAEQAVTWGLANGLVPAGRIEAAAQAAARDIAAKRPGAVSHTKQLLGPDPALLTARLEAERAHFVAQVQTAEARQGIRDYLERQAERKVAA